MKKILVVDNDRFMLEFMNDILSKEGHDVVTASDGLSALDVLKNYTPDFIFTDIIMPKIDGKKFCSLVRRIPKFTNTHIVILSAVAFDDGINIDELGANSLIAKGSMNEMVSGVLGILQKSENSSSESTIEARNGLSIAFSKEATQELLSIKNHFEAVLKTISEGILEITSEGRVIYANPSAISLLGVPEENLMGSYFTELFSENDYSKVKNLLKIENDRQKQIEEDCLIELNTHQVILKILPLRDDGSTSIVVLNDVSERKRAENALLESERMKGVLEMAGAVCHELSQPLQVLYGYSHFLSQQIDKENPLNEKINLMINQTDRIAFIIKKLDSISQYATKDYLKGKIIDIDKATR